MEARKKSVYKQMQRLADVTKIFIQQGHINRAKKCLRTAEELFESGNVDAKNAVANVYVFSLTSFVDIHKCKIKSLFPDSLLNIYYKQINSSGI